MPLADANGQRLYYEDTGEGPALVFSHGLFMDHAMFDPQVLVLRERYRCITWDQRGHGDSGYPDGPFTYWDSAEDLRALLALLEVDRAVLLGMSQGGFLSLRTALRDPALVRGLVLIDTQAGTENPEVLPYYQTLLEQWNTAGLTEELAEIISTLILGVEWEGAEEWIEKWREMDVNVVNELFATLAGREDIHDRLPEIDIPALVVHGAEDLSIPVAVGQRMADRLPKAVTLIVAGAGHASNLTHAEAVTPAIEQFLELLPPA